MSPTKRREKAAPSPSRMEIADRDEVATLLDIDREYRECGANGELPVIAPHRFNPSDERWLPILHTTRGDRHYTALFSNTATAHRMHRTHDWVVIYRDGAGAEQQFTVVTEFKGPLARRRVVRGRESVAYYRLTAREALRHRLDRNPPTMLTPPRRRRRASADSRRSQVDHDTQTSLL